MLAALLVAVVALAGCRDTDRDRPDYSEKGVYPGPVKEGADVSTLREYRFRVRRQGFSL